MSELAEVNRRLNEMMEITVRTSQDVTWIKAGMATIGQRIDKQDDEIGKVKGRQNWISGFYAALGLLIGGAIDHFKSSWMGPIL